MSISGDSRLQRGDGTFNLLPVVMRALQTSITVLLVAVAVMGAAADEADMGVGVSSAYVWRGITRNENPVVQPFTEFTFDMFSVGTWGNINLDEADEIQTHGLFSEVDITLSWVFSLDVVDCNVGWIEYLYSNGSNDTREVYGVAKIDLFEDVFADLGIYYDVDEIDDIYARTRLGYTIRLGESLDAELAGSVAVAGKDMSAGDSGGFHDYSLSLGLVHGAGSLCEMAATVAYTGSLDEDVLPEQEVEFYVTCGVTVGF